LTRPISCDGLQENLAARRRRSVSRETGNRPRHQRGGQTAAPNRRRRIRDASL